jgi:DNA-binding transcriptional regulator LsrR (DeoR family)
MFPLTQEALADALGMSSVHVSRTLSQLKREGLIAYSNGRMTVMDHGGLSERAER